MCWCPAPLMTPRCPLLLLLLLLLLLRLQVIYSYAFGVLVFHEHLTSFGVVGTLLVAVGKQRQRWKRAWGAAGRHCLTMSHNRRCALCPCTALTCAVAALLARRTNQQAWCVSRSSPRRRLQRRQHPTALQAARLLPRAPLPRQHGPRIRRQQMRWTTASSGCCQTRSCRPSSPACRPPACGR
jgi:hypothetical protein